MNTEFSKEIHSKVLIFGEYSVLYNSQAVAVPFDSFSGKLDFSEQKKESLMGLHDYLTQRSTSLDLEKLLEDLENGLHFDSNIPYGQGLGSSAALSASIYKNYGKNIDQNDLAEIKDELGVIESYFHGKSSGFDPLVCYVGRPVVVNTGGEIEVYNSFNTSRDYRIYLVPTNEQRVGKNVINQILEKLQCPDFERRFVSEYVTMNDHCVGGFLENNEQFKSNIFDLSKLQLDIFEEIINLEIKTLWNEGLVSGDYYMKLCGAGGGGYYLAFSFNKSFKPPSSWKLLKENNE